MALTEFVASRATVPTAGADLRSQVAARLHHRALPKLAEVGALEYDERDGLVRYRGGSDLESLATLAASAEYRET